MKLIGIEGCSACKIAKKFLDDIPYIELRRKGKSNIEIMEIKRALGKLNKGGKFPVILDDSHNKILETKFIMDNLNSVILRNKLKNQ